jgi:hypothetical protein
MEKMRVLYVLYEFPQISQTYMKSELEALQHDYDIRVITRNAAHNPYPGHFPFTEINDLEAIREAAREFKPHVLHGHYLHTASTSRTWPNPSKSHSLYGLTHST